MRSVVLQLLFLYAAQVQAEQANFDEVSSERTMSNVADMLAERGCNEGSRLHADLDQSTLGKSSQIPVGVPASSPGLRVSPSFRNTMPVGPCDRQTVRRWAQPLWKKQPNPQRVQRLTKKAQEAKEKYKAIKEANKAKYKWKEGDPPKPITHWFGGQNLRRNIKITQPKNVETVSVRTLRGYINEADVKILGETIAEAKKSTSEPQWFFFKTIGVRGKKLRFTVEDADKVEPTPKEAAKKWEGYEGVSCSYDFKTWFTVPTEYKSHKQELKFELKVPPDRMQIDELYCAYKVPKAALADR